MTRSFVFRSLLAAAALAAVCEVPAQSKPKKAKAILLPPGVVQGKDGERVRERLAEAIDLLQAAESSEESRDKALAMLEAAMEQLDKGDYDRARVFYRKAKDRQHAAHREWAAIALQDAEATAKDGLVASLKKAHAADPELKDLFAKLKADGADLAFGVQEAKKARKAYEVAKAAKARAADEISAYVRRGEQGPDEEDTLRLRYIDDEGLAKVLRHVEGKGARGLVGRLVEDEGAGGDGGDIVEAINGVRAELRAIRELMERAHRTMDHDGHGRYVGRDDVEKEIEEVHGDGRVNVFRLRSDDGRAKDAPKARMFFERAKDDGDEEIEFHGDGGGANVFRWRANKARGEDAPKARLFLRAKDGIDVEAPHFQFDGKGKGIWVEFDGDAGKGGGSGAWVDVKVAPEVDVKKIRRVEKKGGSGRSDDGDGVWVEVAPKAGVKKIKRHKKDTDTEVRWNSAIGIGGGSGGKAGAKAGAERSFGIGVDTAPETRPSPAPKVKKIEKRRRYVR